MRAAKHLAVGGEDYLAALRSKARYPCLICRSCRMELAYMRQFPPVRQYQRLDGLGDFRRNVLVGPYSQ
jgi:hypothetical protein